MPLQATSGAASYDGFGGGVAVEPVYIEQIFSTYLYTGNGSTQTITNGIDLSTKGGLVWQKTRDGGTTIHVLCDTARGVNDVLQSNDTSGSINNGGTDAVYAYNANGFSTGTVNGTAINLNNRTAVSWTFRKQLKFFDVVTYTGNSTAGRAISHNLGSVPGCIIVKATNGTSSWFVYHQSLGNTSALFLQATNAAATSSAYWNNTSPTSTEFTLGGGSTNTDTVTYVAYLFAHNAGGFGLTGTDNVISCGSYTGNGSATGPVVTLGYEAQFVMIKRATGGAGSWLMHDVMRGMSVGGNTATLYANLNIAEQDSGVSRVQPTATGFQIANTATSDLNTNGSDYIYIAIRRGPMNVPTVGTSVFVPAAQTDTTPVTTNFPVDFFLENVRAGSVYNTFAASRLTGNSPNLRTSSTMAEESGNMGPDTFTSNTKLTLGIFGASAAIYAFQRAPSFMDVVCYTGTGADLTLSHNLQAVPQMIICKARSTTSDWPVYHKDSYNGFYGGIDLDSPLNGTSNYSTLGAWKATPTSSVFYLPSPTYSTVNESGQTYVAYLFSTCAGVSKVGGYTGTGTTKQIDCGFTGGARFVLIKRTDSTGSWYVWDVARGISSGNDPYLLLNSTAAEVTNTDYIDTYSAGFELSSTAPAAINASGGSFIFLAIA